MAESQRYKKNRQNSMEATDKEVLQRKLIRFLTSEVFNTISEEDVLKRQGGSWTLKGQPLTKGQVDVLKKEAKSFSQMLFYRVLQDEIRWHARGILEKAETQNDIISAKLLSYFTDVVTSKVKKIAEL